MQVTVKGFFEDDSKWARKEFSVTLSEEDGKTLFPNNWSSWGASTKYRKLRAIADIFVLQYSVSRGFRSQEAVANDIETIILQDLQGVSQEDMLSFNNS